MAAPVVVTLDRSPSSPLDLTARVAPGSLKWSSVVPGGFGSFQATLIGDPRRLVKEIPYLSIVRVVGDSGRTLFEGQIEDRGITITGDQVGLKIAGFGMQNVTKEKSLRRIWSKRDMGWTEISNINGMKTNVGNACVLGNNGWQTNSGQFDPTDLSKIGVQIVGVASSSLAVRAAMAMEFKLPLGLTAYRILGTCRMPTAAGVTAGVWSSASGTGFGNSLAGFAGVSTTDFDEDLTDVGGNPVAAQIRLGVWNSSGGALSVSVDDGPQFYNLRVLGTSVVEDEAAVAHAGGGFYGDSLIRDILAQIPALAAGVIESGSDFTIDHLDAGVRRNAYDILNEVAGYYSREWAVWEGAKLDWVTPNLQENQWVIPLAQLADLDLDASTVNSQEQAIVLYTDASSGLDAEEAVSSSDRRNPYVLNGRAKDLVVDGGTMTANTATQLATILMDDIGFGPVPAAGTVSLLGESIVQHAQGNALKAWELRAGDNVTIPELPMADVFTQDGRGEVLFHIVSSEADTESGIVTLTLDSYGSKRSDVLLARLAAVTGLLGG